MAEDLKIVELLPDQPELLMLFRRCEASEHRLVWGLKNGQAFGMRSGREIACAALVVKNQERVCQLYELFTNDFYRHRGYASRLVRWLMARYHRSCSTMIVGVTEKDAQFFQSLGFQAADASVIPEDNRTDVIYFAKSLQR